MTTTQVATDEELQHMGENFHGIRVDFDQISATLKHFVNVCKSPQHTKSMEEEWKTVEDEYIKLMTKSDGVAVKLDAQISGLKKDFDKLEPDGSKNMIILDYDIQKLGVFAKDATDLSKAFSKSEFRGSVEHMKGSEIDWGINSYISSLLDSLYKEIKDVLSLIQQEFNDAFSGLLQRLTIMERIWLRLKEDSITLREKLLLLIIQHSMKDFDAQKKEAYSLVIEMHTTLQAYISAASSHDNVPDEIIDQ